MSLLKFDAMKCHFFYSIYFSLYFCSSYDYVTDAKTEDQADMSAEDKLLLEAYTLCLDEDKIDYNLIVCLLERICASQEEGNISMILAIVQNF